MRNTSYKDETLFATMVTMIADVTVAASVKFERVKSNPKVIRALRIHCIGAGKQFDIDFYNIPLNNTVRSNYQDSTVGSTEQPTSSNEQSSLLNELIKVSERFNEARVTGDKAVLEELLAEKFNYYDQRFDKSTDRTKFIEKAKKGSVSSFNCRDYKLDREPVGWYKLKGTCDFRSRALLGMLDMSGTFSMTVTGSSRSWKIFTFQVYAKPIQ